MNVKRERELERRRSWYQMCVEELVCPWVVRWAWAISKNSNADARYQNCLIFWTSRCIPCEPGLKFTCGSDHYWLTSGTGSALVQLMTPCEPSFMVTCNLYFVYGLRLFKKWNFFNWWFLSFHWCYMHRHAEGDLRGFICLPETILLRLNKSHSN